MKPAQRVPRPRGYVDSPTDSSAGRFCVKLATLTAASLLIAACNSSGEYSAPTMGLAAEFSGAPPSVARYAADPWWEAYQDARLNQLVEDGLVQNLTIRQAMERVNAAEAIAGAAGLTTTIDGSLSAQKAGEFGSDGSSLIKNGILNFSWIADFFGQYASAQASADARLDAAIADVDAARLVYLSEIVSAYIDARFYQESLALKRKDLESREKTLALTADLLNAGEATQLAVASANGLVNDTKALIPYLENGFNLSVNRIATLIGRPTSAILAEMRKPSPQPVPHRKVSAGVPADLIRNRADIRAAERLLASAVAEVGVAEAQLYPSISLAGSIQGRSASSVSVQGWSFGPVIDIPIFDRGQREAQLSVAESVARERYLQWQELVLEAVEEVEDALSSISNSAKASGAAREAVRSYEDALGLARVTFENGEITLIDVLNTEQSLGEARTIYADNVRKQAQDFLALNVALGGGQAVPGPVSDQNAPVAQGTTPPKGKPAAAEVAVAPAVTGSSVWIVQPGETLYRIAVNNNMSVEALAAANGISPPWTIRVGQSIVIPARPPV
jgi:outer membrane protein, multidrug efflux system